jgi:hypothetical protein
MAPLYFGEQPAKMYLGSAPNTQIGKVKINNIEISLTTTTTTTTIGPVYGPYPPNTMEILLKDKK